MFKIIIPGVIAYYFEISSCYVAQAGLKFMTLLPHTTQMLGLLSHLHRDLKLSLSLFHVCLSFIHFTICQQSQALRVRKICSTGQLRFINISPATFELRAPEVSVRRNL